MKSRQDIPDNQFDEFFKQAAENYRPPFNPQAWRKMDKKLNRVQGIGGFNTGKFLVTLALVLLVDIIFISSERNSGEFNQQDYLSGGIGFYEDQDQGANTSQKREGTNGQLNPPYGDNGRPTNTPTEDRNEANITAFDRGKRVENFNSHENEEILKDPAKESSPEILLKKPFQIQTLVYQPLNSTKTFLSMPEEEIKGVKTESVSILSPPDHPLHGLSIHGRISPDFSSVGFMGQTSLGINAGLLIEYELIDRFSVSVGASDASKKYAALEGYQPFPGFWEQVEKPEIIEGTCTVYDLSVNLRYDFIDQKGYKIFVRPGMSSWLMKSEAYEYLYGPNANTEDFTYSPENKFENKHWFGLLNLSAGYEHRLNENWGIEVNPFIQVPVTEIGAGNVPLQTKGTYFSIKYSFK